MTRALAIVCLAALGGGLSVAAQQSPEPVFTTPAPATVGAVERTAPARGVAARTVVGMRLDRLFAGSRVTLNVDGHDWIAAVEEINGTVNEHRAWVGSIEGIPYSHVSVVERAGVVAGLINAVGVTYAIRTLSPGRYTLDRMMDRTDDSGPLIWNPEAREPGALAAGSVIAADDDPSFVDVLLLYTPAARDDVGGNAQMAAVIAQVISDSNTIFNRSGIGTRLRLVGASELAYIETSNIAVDLAALSANAAVNALRDSLGADVVQLLAFGADLSACGVGYLYQGTIPSEFPAFSVSAIDCVSQYTPTHEIGHTMGSHHNPEQAGGTPLYPYSYGYRDAASPYPFRTVMSYTCPSVNCPRIASFSNPNVAHQDNGRPTGGPLQNNALSINNAAPLVANFRPTKQPAGSCSYAVTPPWLSFASGAATAAITITTQTGCFWTTTLGAAWTNVTPASGTGTTTLTVSVAANDTNSDRAASVVLEGVAVSVKQSGPCTWALTPSALMFQPVAGEQTLAIDTAAGCTWTTSTDSSWLSVSPPSGSGAATVIVQAVNNAGRPRVGTITVAGSTASVTQASPLPLVAAPIDLREVGTLGDRVTLAWTAGVGQLDATGYLVEGGLSPGDVLGSLPTGSNSPAVTFYAPTGALYLRVRAVAGANLGPPSNEIRVFVNVPPPPSAPANLLGLIHGDRAFLSWTPTGYGGAATAFQINVTGNVTDSFVISAPTETFAVSGVPPGNYAVSVVALNPQGVSPPSPTIALQVPSPCAAPQAPTNVQVMQIQRVLSVLWDPPVAGSAITHYAVRISGAAQGVLQTIERAVSQEVSPGSYTLRVTAVNTCGLGVSSPERTVIVP